jgi:hypothetical protein
MRGTVRGKAPFDCGWNQFFREIEDSTGAECGKGSEKLLRRSIRMPPWVQPGRSLWESDKKRGLIPGEVAGRLSKIREGCGFDTTQSIPIGSVVQVFLEDTGFAPTPFELEGDEGLEQLGAIGCLFPASGELYHLLGER